MPASAGGLCSGASGTLASIAVMAASSSRVGAVSTVPPWTTRCAAAVMSVAVMP
jgi:hypothetical protein